MAQQLREAGGASNFGEEVGVGHMSEEAGNDRRAKGRQKPYGARELSTMSTHSNGGSTWSTKLQRISSRSSGDRAMLFNNVGHVIDEDCLRDCFHKLDGTKAVGQDGMTKHAYGLNLSKNLKDLLSRIRRGTYRPKPARIVEIPKEDGSTRPLAISCLEDKIVQMAASRVLEAIYEPIFLPGSYGFRRDRSAHDAIEALWEQMNENGMGAVVEIDLRKYFNTVPHRPLGDFLRKKIGDNRFLGLLITLMKAPVVDADGRATPTAEGVPQGSIVSPILANIYLHHVIDEWVEELSRAKHILGRFAVVRYADDMVFTFEYEQQSERFFRVLPKRLAKYGLSMNIEKSSLQPGGRWSLRDNAPRPLPKPVFNFVGFEVSWVKTRRGHYRPRFRPRRDRMYKRAREIKRFLWRNLNAPNHMLVLEQVAKVVRGWVNLFAVSDSRPRIRDFIRALRRYIHRWFNRRGGNRYIPWKSIEAILTRVGIVENIHLKSILTRRTKDNSGVSGA